MEAVEDVLQMDEEIDHKILVMHHFPDKINFKHGWIPKNFWKPKPEKVAAWIEETGASLVLCGHVHETDEYGYEGYHVLVSGACCAVHQANPNLRAFHVVDLKASGQWDAEVAEYPVWELDAHIEDCFE